MEKLFKLSENKTTVKTEIIAGLTTFLAMAYILAVNPSILTDGTGMDYAAVFTATAISSGVASILMGLLANYPVALAPGMGVNALFTYTVCLQYGLSWQASMAAVMVSGIVFLLITVTGLRKAVIASIPQQMKLAIGAGIGFFIAFVGLKNAGIIISDPSTAVAVGDLTQPTVVLALFGIVLTIGLLIKKVPAAVFVGMIITAIVGLVCGFMGIEGMPTLPTSLSSGISFAAVGGCFQGFGELFANPLNAVLIIFSFLFVDFFDTAGTLVAVGNNCGLVQENGELKNVERALLADSIGTCVGAFLGTSTVTSFVESTSGVEVGGRTGLTAVTTGVLFFLSLLLAPVFLSLFTNAVTAPALIVVGILMAQQLKGIDWDDVVIAAPAFITIAFMILGYSIANGIAAGFIVYTVACLFANKTKDLSIVIYLLDIIFILYFIFK